MLAYTWSYNPNPSDNPGNDHNPNNITLIQTQDNELLNDVWHFDMNAEQWDRLMPGVTEMILSPRRLNPTHHKHAMVKRAHKPYSS